MAQRTLKRPKRRRISFTLLPSAIDQLYSWAEAYGITPSQALEHGIPRFTADMTTPITIAVLPRGPAAAPPPHAGPSAPAPGLSHPAHPAPGPAVMG
jgi:hypothetical protein